MSIATGLLGEFDMEMASTRRMLERLPEDKLEWKPDPKSMSMGRLAAHVAEMPGWGALTMNSDELDFSKGEYKPGVASSRAEALKILEESAGAARAAIEKASDADFMKPWTLRSGDQVFFTLPGSKTIVVSTASLSFSSGQVRTIMALDGPSGGVTTSVLSDLN